MRFLKSLMIIGVCFGIALIFEGSAAAEVKITNLHSKPAYVVTRTWQPYSSRSGDLTVVTSAGWIFTGWYKIAPGGTFRTSDNKVLFVEKDGRPVTWDLKKSFGLVRKGKKFSIKLNKGSQTEDVKRFRSQGFIGVNFMTFKKGSYHITGDRSYRVTKKRFTFNYESRSVKFINDSFSVNGQVVDYYYKATKKWASNIRWKINQRSVHLSGSVEGHQVRFAGPREPGKYKGHVDVEYTVRR